MPWRQQAMAAPFACFAYRATSTAERSLPMLLTAIRIPSLTSSSTGAVSSLLREYYLHLAEVSQATFRPAPSPGKYPMVTCCANGEVRAWTEALTTNHHGKGMEYLHPGAVVSASWSKDGNWLATVGGGDVLIWHWPANQEHPAGKVRILGLTNGTSRGEFSPDGKSLITYGGDNAALLWDLSSFHPN